MYKVHMSNVSIYDVMISWQKIASNYIYITSYRHLPDEQALESSIQIMDSHIWEFFVDLKDEH